MEQQPRITSEPIPDLCPECRTLHVDENGYKMECPGHFPTCADDRVPCKWGPDRYAAFEKCVVCGDIRMKYHHPQ